MPREYDHRVRAAKDFAGSHEHSHFLKRLFVAEVQPFLNGSVLERLELEAAFRQNVLEPKRQSAAETAIPIVENPTSKWNIKERRFPNRRGIWSHHKRGFESAPPRGNGFRWFCCFCQFRNHLAIFFRQPRLLRGA
jgi:hypothetical protein